MRPPSERAGSRRRLRPRPTRPWRPERGVGPLPSPGESPMFTTRASIPRSPAVNRILGECEECSPPGLPCFLRLVGLDAPDAVLGDSRRRPGRRVPRARRTGARRGSRRRRRRLSRPGTWRGRGPPRCSGRRSSCRAVRSRRPWAFRRAWRVVVMMALGPSGGSAASPVRYAEVHPLMQVYAGRTLGVLLGLAVAEPLAGGGQVGGELVGAAVAVPVTDQEGVYLPGAAVGVVRQVENLAGSPGPPGRACGCRTSVGPPSARARPSSPRI